MVLLQSKAVCLLHMNKIFIGLLLLLLVAGCNRKNNSLPFYNTADFTAEWINRDDAKYKDIHTIDTFSLQNQLGYFITNDSLKGNIYIANFFFTICPAICPRMINNLQILQDSFTDNKQVKLVSFSVMPRVDSVKRLKEYGENHHINPGKWYLLTGNKERIYKLGRQSYFAEKRLGLLKDSTDFLHTESMLLIDKAGRIRGVYNATDNTDVGRITEDIKTLLTE